MNVSHYWKSIIAAVGAAAFTIETAISDGVFTSSEIVSAVLAVLIALGVYVVPNKPDLPLKEITT